MQKEGSKLREGDGILEGQTHGSLQPPKTEITVSILQNFTGRMRYATTELAAAAVLLTASRSFWFPFCSNKSGVI